QLRECYALRQRATLPQQAHESVYWIALRLVAKCIEGDALGTMHKIIKNGRGNCHSRHLSLSGVVRFPKSLLIYKYPNGTDNAFDLNENQGQRPRAVPFQPP